ncbi:uncharacterized protein N7459_001269 [Penicillium hispanicum]|uniref:uncharacterized protein n=1 Tax=Penicillium hispanicum TaxID=1080232 RepID=UPI002541F493|nr:uncharacterized protein N7459_001269 [Penicillium hispanicum]KAJ5595061.1 hypothetical protein N7459_001269 [Penicillium hispanicum]
MAPINTPGDMPMAPLIPPPVGPYQRAPDTDHMEADLKSHCEVYGYEARQLLLGCLGPTPDPQPIRLVGCVSTRFLQKAHFLPLSKNPFAPNLVTQLTLLH